MRDKIGQVNYRKVNIKRVNLGETKAYLRMGIGLDLGIRNFIVTSTGEFYKNINDTEKIKSLSDRVLKINNSIKRKIATEIRIVDKESEKKYKHIESNNIKKLRIKLQKIKNKIRNVRKEYIRKICSEIILRKPNYITIEDIDPHELSKNRRIKQYILSSDFKMFLEILKHRCDKENIQLRMVDRSYPSSKICSKCGSINSRLKLSDKIFKCNCGYEIDRDLNAARNLSKANKYKIIK